MDIEIIRLQAVVNRGLARKYKRFRLHTSWYGGSASLDCVGCFGHCPACWTYKSNTEPERFGDFYSPEQVVSVIPPRPEVVRVSAGEPTLNFPHLVRLLELLPRDKMFLLETNGVLLGEGEVRELSQFTNLHVRLSLKGVDDKTSGLYFGWPVFTKQMELVELLRQHGVSFHCCIIDLFPRDKITAVASKLKGEPTIVKGPVVGQLEVERYKEYPFTKLKVRRFKEELPKVVGESNFMGKV